MRFIIENVKPEYLKEVAQLMREARPLRMIGIECIQITNGWVPVESEWMDTFNYGPIISFEIPNAFFMQDEVMRTLTSVFEGTRLIFSSPDMPELRFRVA